MRNNQGTTGVSSSFLSAQLNKSQQVIRQAVDFLSSEGHLFMSYISNDEGEFYLYSY